MRFKDKPRRTWKINPDEESYVLEAVLTEEGVILDAYAYGEHQGTKAMMADEWFDSLLPKCVHCHRGLLWKDNTLVDITGGDVCGAHGTNHPHCRQYDPYPILGSVVCNECHLSAEDHEQGNN